MLELVQNIFFVELKVVAWSHIISFLFTENSTDDIRCCMDEILVGQYARAPHTRGVGVHLSRQLRTPML